MTASFLHGVLLSLALALAATAATAETNVLFIVDASGSMKKAVEGEPRMTAAKRVLGEALSAMPAEARLGMLVYGHRKAKDCKDIELVAPIGAEDAATLASRVQELTPKGETPIAAALQAAAKSFLAFKGQQNTIVLVTDGIEECQGDPCAAARAIREAGLDLKVDIVGFTLKEEQKKLIQCVATETGGTYYDAKNAAALSAALTAVSRAVAAPAPKPAPEPDNNILAAANGGTLVAAPTDQWLMLNDGADDGTKTVGEGVWSFKDGRPATFDAFEMLIPAAHQSNIKEFELLAGDEGPGGTFRSIGKFTAQNLKLIQSPYQKFTFAPTTARFLKVKVLSNHGWFDTVAYEFRLRGTLEAASTAAAAPSAAPSSIDLLAPANGGALVAAPTDQWLKLNDGAEEGTKTVGEGVWSFKDGRPATFDAFEMLIPAAHQSNIQEFELLAGDEGPGGAFRSIGKFAAQNTRLVQSPYQRFAFAPTTARFFKVKVLSNFGWFDTIAYEFRLHGTLGEAAAAAPAQSAPAAGIDLLAPANGGALIAAPQDQWLKLNDGAEDAADVGGEGVWAFKDGKPATFDAFEMLIPAAHASNVNEFELLAGDEGPGGAFRSIGKFTTQNTRMVQSPYQTFTFAPTTARFLKVKVLSNFGYFQTVGYEFRLHGVIDEAAAAAAPNLAPAGTDLLAAANGGNLLGAPHENWTQLTDGQEGAIDVTGGEGIWAFSGEKPATFDTFQMLVPAAHNGNVNEFELFVAEDSPSGSFRSIGKFSAQNMRLFPSGYQTFTFAPVRARYFKVQVLSNHGYFQTAAYEFRLFGQIEP